MILTVFEVFKLNQSIERLIEQDCNLSFNNGYKLIQIKRELDDIEQYAVSKLNQVIDNERLKSNEMTEEEQMVYVTVMNNEVEVSDIKIDFDNIKENNEITLPLSDIEMLSVFFEEKKSCTED